ncbi:hypothetical protein ACVWZV_004437 [Bradyrhizobium sp. GM5.1]
MTRPARARSFNEDDAVCTNVSGLLASGPLLRPGHDEIRACRSQINGSGSKPAFLHRVYGAPIDCFVITFTNLAVWNKRDQLKAGSRRS